ncbi:MAG TPA: hypothetical protein VJ276_15390 [Thermoanaerobaculia bacterium]|nr:hypothetical protein [Thermoanaerobaculia bacterium]
MRTLADLIVGGGLAPLEALHFAFQMARVDPTRALNWRMLSVCCEKSGDLQRAAEAHLRATAVMDNAEPPFPVE